jgi:hypothetical protein
VVNMRDPHVVELRYRVQYSDSVALDTDSLPVEREFDSFRLRVTDEAATAEMKAHYATEEAAREAVEAILRPWEIFEAVHPRAIRLRFAFEEAEVVDRDPPPLYLEGRVEPAVQLEARILREQRFPEPPKEFALSPDVEVMWSLYEGYLRGPRKDRLLPMAYTCLTRLTYSVGGNEQQAAKKYGISRKILTKLASLSSSGDEATARKWDPRRPPQALTDREIDWVESAVRKLILRAGQYAADPAREWPQITKAHLPTLEDEER